MARISNKKELILESAYQIFKEKGLEDTRVSQIVKKAGIAQGTFYLYYNSKMDVLPDLAQQIISNYTQYLTEHGDIEAGLDANLRLAIDRIFEVNQEDRTIPSIVYAGITRSGDIDKWKVIYRPLYDLIADYLKAAKANGEIREDIHPDYYSEFVISLIESTARGLILFQHSPEEVEKYKEELSSFILNAVSWTPIKVI
ncbi:TetR family transcriptional regulator [Oceanobacillus oncorhynchi subsp. incaldanensis]|uniref:TetR family transcriptional regulator n=2 Tax=Oceanobacillus TaxID=182709 RepID=A0ABV9JW06_9BACI|nr:TetR family transcriptional regulator [Oceanobacillus oncorhynchi]MDM8100133.1 TetR family transcriptional regulator [Oceanobacillus oncorhynchi]UUI41044.1 TetR family transcriptional regulator [Oceanobacillus oncorhynchi]GIO19832.1 TetR family transcriptional regulator [Oceanobacillus oncorhynchi subsp. incaldanensis]CEI82493.1 putative HTH-type transcriptional regulator YvdT [Oceanobacillus oncorhynchi]